MGVRLALAALAIAGCDRAEPPRQAKVDAVPIAKRPPEPAIEKVVGLEGARVEVRGAYFYPLDKAWFRPADDDVLIAVEAEFHLSGAGGFDPDDLEVVDADSGAELVRAKATFRLTGDGRMADWRDPVFTDPDQIRVVVVRAVTRGPRRVTLRHAGRDLAAPVSIGQSGPSFEPPSFSVIAHAAAGAAPLAGYQRHRVLLEMRNWTRMDTPRHYKLAYALAGSRRLADADKWLEVDDALAAAAVSIEALPTQVPRRRFLVEYWLVEGGTVNALDEYGRATRLPAAALSLPPATEKALAGAEPDLDASHYQEQ